MKFETFPEHQRFGLEFRLRVEFYEEEKTVAYYQDRPIQIDTAIYSLEWKRGSVQIIGTSLIMNAKQTSEDLNTIFVQLLHNFTKVGPDPSAPLEIRHNYVSVEGLRRG